METQFNAKDQFRAGDEERRAKIIANARKDSRNDPFSTNNENINANDIAAKQE